MRSRKGKKKKSGKDDHLPANTWDFDQTTDREEDAKAVGKTLELAGEMTPGTGNGALNLEEPDALRKTVSAAVAENWVDDVLPQSTVRKMVTVLVFIYGFIGVLSLV